MSWGLRQIERVLAPYRQPGLSGTEEIIQIPSPLREVAADKSKGPSAWKSPSGSRHYAAGAVAGGGDAADAVAERVHMCARTTLSASSGLE